MHDLSIVTDTLRKIISDALAASPLWGGGPAPFNGRPCRASTPRQPGQSDCELSLYLFHIGRTSSSPTPSGSQARRTAAAAASSRSRSSR